MALTRKYLKELGIESDKIDLIIDAHADVVDGLKAERDEFKEKAGSVADLEKKIKDLESDGTNADEWKEKYEKEHSDFESFKQEQTNKDALNAKENAYKAMLKELGISDKRIDAIMKVTDLKDLELEDGKIKDLETLTESVKAEWEEFIPQEQRKGADIHKPPKGDNGSKPDLSSLSMEEYIKARTNK